MTNDNDLPPTRVAAKAAGLRHYFTSKPCSKGHISKRHITGTCVDCQQIANNAWAARNPGESLKRSSAYYARHPERAKAASVRSWRKRAGIPAAERPNPGACELCAKSNRQMHLDHDHASGKFRGWLCSTCNRAFGMLGDTVAGLEKALDYLRRNGSS